MSDYIPPKMTHEALAAWLVVLISGHTKACLAHKVNPISTAFTNEVQALLEKHTTMKEKQDE